ncbi:MAG TPA: ferritin-like domain-containing protein, partial [Candidatus Acidoferrum sp.]|nr:ferritin-like domain-containing protein [Candidatus Acidoferrum sp.]
MQENSLQELYVEQLRDLYSAENQLVKALPKMAKAAQSPTLRQGFEHHLDQTKGHVDRLEQIFSVLDESPKGRKCAGMEGLVEEGEEVIKEQSSSDALDAGLIASAQRVEHYEIAAYGTVRSFAELLGENDAVDLLQQTLDEEKATDEKLTELSKEVNAQAMEVTGTTNRGEEQGEVEET